MFSWDDGGSLRYYRVRKREAGALRLADSANLENAHRGTYVLTCRVYHLQFVHICRAEVFLTGSRPDPHSQTQALGVHTKCTELNVLNSLAYTFVVLNPLFLYVSGKGAVLSRLHSLPIIIALVFKSHTVIFAASASMVMISPLTHGF